MKESPLNLPTSMAQQSLPKTHFLCNKLFTVSHTCQFLKILKILLSFPASHFTCTQQHDILPWISSICKKRTEEGRLEERLGAPEPLVTDGDDLSVGQLVALFEGGRGGCGLHLLLKVQGDVAQLFLQAEQHGENARTHRRKPTTSKRFRLSTRSAVSRTLSPSTTWKYPTINFFPGQEKFLVNSVLALRADFCLWKLQHCRMR